MKAAVGDAFPDYRLPDHTGHLRALSEIQSGDPMIIVLAREAYSAKDQRQQEGLVELWREIKPGVGYCRLVTITTSVAREALNYRSGVGAEWPFLRHRAESEPSALVGGKDPGTRGVSSGDSVRSTSGGS